MEPDRKPFIAIALLTMLAFTGPLHSDESWQLKRLMNPQQHQLLQESRGSVFIYDGLYESDVEFALSDQFHRIESMMFIRTKIRTNGGTEEADDCS